MTTQNYFCVFSKFGPLMYEKGKRPLYLNALIRSLDTRKSCQDRAIQNEYMFCEFKRDIVYLCITSKNDKSALKQEIDKFEKKEINKNPEEKTLHNNPIVNNKNKDNNNKKSKKWNDSAIEDDLTLDFSEKEDVNEIVYKVEPIKQIKKNYIFNLFRSTIKKSALREIMETHLINKNVSVEITKKIIDDVLYGFEDDIKENEFKCKLREVIKNLMDSVNHNKLLEKIKNKKGVFAFCFIGVNGVGKSTSLAKICCWLLQNNLKVYIAACDTFRAGAIEQLKVHVDAFKRGGYDVGFYERGYGNDVVSVAKSAISLANKENYNVILIDTAGRMHSNKNLMDSLSKLIRVNEFDHVIYVGEALVGNESLDHLKEFNRAVKSGKEKKKIDSIFVTKVDTVDDKVGQILNMSVAGECPVLFIGTGQTNMSLSIIDSGLIADSLMNKN